MEGMPAEVTKYSTSRQSGETGKRGVLVMKLARNLAAGRTFVKEQYSQVPLFAQRPMYLEESLPSMAYMYIISPSGGILQGDTYKIDISLDRGAQAHLTTQGATRIYRMEEGLATQQIDISLDADCYLEYIPDQIIPYAGSRFYQNTNLRVHQDSTVVYSEIITPGRAAAGELFEYDICCLRIRGSDLRGEIKFSDSAMLEPKRINPRAAGSIEEAIVASVYVMTPPRFVPELNKFINGALADMKIYGGSSILPHRCGIAARMLGNSAGNLQSAVVRIAGITRKLVLGAPFTKMRKG